MTQKILFYEPRRELLCNLKNNLHMDNSEAMYSVTLLDSNRLMRGTYIIILLTGWMFALVTVFIGLFLTDGSEFGEGKHTLLYMCWKYLISCTGCVLCISTVDALFLFLTTVIKASTIAVIFQAEKLTLDCTTSRWHCWLPIQRL